MLLELYDASMHEEGLKIIMSKTKVKANIRNVANPSVTVANKMLEIRDQYVYPGHILSFSKKYQI